MPNMVLNRNYVLNSVFGHSIRFTEDQPVHVPQNQDLIEEVLRIGGKFADPETPVPDLTGEEKGLPEPLSGEARETRLKEIVLDLLAQGTNPERRGDFTAANLPRTDAVARLLGGKVHAREIEKIVDTAKQEAATQ